jgi:hypothetical protein
MGDKDDDATKGAQTLSGRKVQQKSAPIVTAYEGDDKADELRNVRSEEEAEQLRVTSGIEAGKAHRARVLARSPLARLTGFKA